MQAKQTLAKLLQDESGNVTIAAAGLSSALFALFGVAVYASSVVVSTHRAQVAGDMASISAATALYTSSTEARSCEVAQQVAAKNKSTLRNCRAEGGDVTVKVAVRGRATTSKAGPM